MSEQISRGFLLKICVWAELIGVLIDQKAVVQIWLWWCIGCFSCPNVDLKRIKATVEPDADPPYMESPDAPSKFFLYKLGVCITEGKKRYT